MSISETLSVALTGLQASQAGMKAVANNISNVNTPGYARQRTTYTPMVLGGRTAGVKIGNVERIADKFLESASFGAAGDVGRYTAQSNYAERLQTLLGQPGDPTSITSRMDAITGAAVKMTTAGLTSITQRAFLDAADSGLMELRTLAKDMNQLKVDAETEIVQDVGRINTLLERVESLNTSIAAGLVTGRAPAAYIDQRVAALDELGQLVKITTREQPDGKMYVEMPNGVALVDNRARALSYTAAAPGIEQAAYPPITVSFIDPNNGSLKPTGEKLEVGMVGGTLGGLLDVRDKLLVQSEAEVGAIYANLASAMNEVSNAGSSFPAIQTLAGRETGLVGSDALNFTGKTSFATVDRSGKVLAKVDVDFASLGPAATIDDAVAAINAGLGGTATASFVDGKLSIQAASGANGVAVADDPATPGRRAGYGFSQFFGLNDIVRSDGKSTISAGLGYSDAHGFPAGQTMEMAVRDGTGRVVSRYSLSTGVGPTVGDLVTDLNASPLSTYGVFSVDPQGRLKMTPASGSYSLAVVNDATARTGTNARLSDMLAAGDNWNVDQLKGSQVRADLAADASKLSLSQLNTSASVGDLGLLSGDMRLASTMVDALSGAKDINGAGKVSMETSMTNFVGRLSLDAARSQESSTDAAARHDDIVLRRESISGVNIDEELAQMIVYQNSYGASAKLMTTAQSMFDQLLSLV